MHPCRYDRIRSLPRLFLSALIALLVVGPAAGVGRIAAREAAKSPPNIVFIMADDLGYGDLGCYGSKLIHTPNLDRLAAEGIRFRNMYAGCTVCAPSRSVLMTGLHMGHTPVRGNAGGADMTSQSLQKGDFTVAALLERARYATSLCGKWGLGDDMPGGRDGLPTKQGFDHFFGYLNQVHAHNYYPRFLWRNTEKVPLRNEVVDAKGRYGGFRGGYATVRVDYSHDLIAREALQFVEEHRGGPFFLYLSLTIPHANNEGTRATGNGEEVPDYGEYAERPWSDPDKGFAAMITRMDRDVGRLVETLKRLGIAERTVVMFTSDNGPHSEGGQSLKRFVSAGPLRGQKRDLYEGGIRVPFIAWWPGTAPAGVTSDHIGYFGDLMATAGELAGVEVPDGLDSVSLAPTLRGQPDRQKEPRYLYWEFYERGSAQAVRAGKWKAVRLPMFTGKTELYDLEKDLGEARDVAAEHPDVVQRLEGFLKEAHRDHPLWKVRGRVPGRRPPPGDGRPRF